MRTIPALALLLILGVALYFSGIVGNGGGEDTNIDVDIEAPEMPAGGGTDGN